MTPAKLAANLSTARPGSKRETHALAPDIAEGLELSDIIYKRREELRPNPVNEVFRRLKSDAYFRDLERDIREAGAILNPLVIMPDGLIIEGESRLLVSERVGIERLPCRVVLSPLTPEEQERRLYLGNLSRFEVDKATRLLLYTRLWPDYYLADARPGQVGELAKAQGVTERQVKRDKAVAKKAAILAALDGDEEIQPEHIEAAQASVNAERRESATTSQEGVILARVRRALTEIRKRESKSQSSEEQFAYADAAELLEEALG